MGSAIDDAARLTFIAAFLARAVEFRRGGHDRACGRHDPALALDPLRGAAARGSLVIPIVVPGWAIASLVPIGLLRLIVGGFQIICGLERRTRSILRAGGAKAMHDEDRIHAEEVVALAAEPLSRRPAWTGSASRSRSCPRPAGLERWSAP
jgi:uncharacterized membrane protein